MSKVLIIAPHVDDELIGCYSILADASNNCTVLYLNNELSPARKEEALRASEKLNFIPDFSGSFPSSSLSFDRILVPSRRDWHKDHREANCLYRCFATDFYSVDMAQGKYLGDMHSLSKRFWLNTLYPSQKSLWENNSKYWLFEDIQKNDYILYHTLPLILPKIHPATSNNFRNMRITIPEIYADSIRNLINCSEFNPMLLGVLIPKDFINGVLSICKYGKVTILNDDGVIAEFNE